jgi:hypothetical protein
MSNLSDSAPTEVDDSPIVFDDGPAEETVEYDDTIALEDDTPAEPEYDFLEVDDTLANKYVKVKVDGEEISVPLNEALQGYQRQEAFTRKTQETARLRQEAEQALQLQQAFQSSPGLTVQILAQQAGVSVEQFLGLTPSQQQAAINDFEEEEYTDPLERKLAQQERLLQSMVERQEAREADEYLRSQVAVLKQTFQVDDDTVREVVGQALNMGVGPEAFPMIYQALAYQKLQVQQQAQQQLSAQQQEVDAKRRAAAARASGMVSSGSGATNVTSIPSANGIKTPRDAVLAAFDQIEAER